MIRYIRGRSTRVGVGLTVLLAVLSLTACGGDEGGSEPTGGGAQSTQAGSDDPGGGSGGQGDIDVGDFPLPVPDGVLLDALADAGVSMEGQLQLYYPNDDFDRLVDFYDDWTSENGEWIRGESDGVVVWQSADTASLRMISVSPDHDPGAQADGPVTFLLLVAGN